LRRETAYIKEKKLRSQLSKVKKSFNVIADEIKIVPVSGERGRRDQASTQRSEKQQVIRKRGEMGKRGGEKSRRKNPMFTRRKKIRAIT